MSSNFSKPQISQQYNKIGNTKLSNNLNCLSTGKLCRLALLNIAYIALVACSINCRFFWGTHFAITNITAF